MIDGKVTDLAISYRLDESNSSPDSNVTELASILDFVLTLNDSSIIQPRCKVEAFG